jgi:hypothetical protein
MARAQTQYLDRYAEPEASVVGTVRRRFAHVLTIPAYGEGASLFDTLASVPSGSSGDVLTILVINGRIDSPPSTREANLAVLERLALEFGSGERIATGVHLTKHPRGALLLIDRATPGRELPVRQGVGLARKIGADVALSLWAAGSVDSPWIHCTDADAMLPVDYFTSTEGVGDAAALTYPFRHVEDTDEKRRLDALEYEISLRYYVAGLKFAESPYAFHTIGSALAIHAVAYSQVRGFPKRLAAEDFYLLNKLAKVGRVKPLGGEPIRLSARISSRVPFGTGRALGLAQQRDRSREPLLLYHPDVFIYLGVWKRTLDALANSGAASELGALLEKHAATRSGLDTDLLRAALTETGAWKAAETGAARRRTPEVLTRHLHDGFDGARTLKLIHALRAKALSSIPLSDALAIAPFLRWERPAGLEAARDELAAR